MDDSSDDVSTNKLTVGPDFPKININNNAGLSIMAKHVQNTLDAQGRPLLYILSVS